MYLANFSGLLDDAKCLGDLFRLVSCSILIPTTVCRLSNVKFQEDFRDFVFANLTRLWTDMNPDFFKGTVVEGHVAKLLSDALKQGAGADMAVAAAK